MNDKVPTAKILDTELEVNYHWLDLTVPGVQ